MKIGILILDAYKQRARKKNYIDIDLNMGINIICNEIKNNFNINPNYIKINEVHNYDIILIPLISVFDCFNLIYTFERAGLDAQKIKGKIIYGGFGVLNIKPIIKYADYFVFGRAENIIADLINAIIKNKDFFHESVFNTEKNNFSEKFKIAQSETIYEKDGLKETMLGCENKCFFCSYSFTRKYFNQNDGFLITRNIGGAETTFKDLKGDVYGMLVGIDGVSERLRLAFNKQITDKFLKEKLENIAKDLKKVWGFNAYLIFGYPTETKKERVAFLESFSFLENITRENINITIRPTIFRAMSLTPSYFCPVNLKTDYRKEFEDNMFYENKLKIADYAYKTKVHIRSEIFTLEGNLTVLMDMILHRGGFEANNILKNIIFNPKIKKLKSYEATQYLLSIIGNKYTKQYEIGDYGETEYLETYISRKTIDNMSRKLKNALQI